jgi:hypothetical protein
MLSVLFSALLASPQASGIAAWDTGKPSPAPLSAEALGRREGWVPVARDAAPPAAFRGDAVVGNGRIAAVLRREAPGVEVYSTEAEGAVLRGVLRLSGASRLERVSLVEHARGAACLEAAWKTAQGAELTARFRLKRGDPSVEVEPRAGAVRVRVECPSRYVVLPDFFADDILIDATRLPLASTELPSENFLIHPLGKGEALGLVVFENREQDVRVDLAGEGEARVVSGAEIDFGKGRKVWLSILTAPGLWHVADVREADAKKVAPLDWKAPFAAQWRVDFTRTNGLSDSWEMLVQKQKGGEFYRQEWFEDWQRKMGSDRKRWTTVLGSFPYPCWIDSEGKGWLQPLDHPKLTFRGPALIYPINRVKETPPEAFTVVDAVRNTLGLGPCEYILDLEGQKEKYQGLNTCSVRDRFNEIFPAGRQKEKRAEMEKMMDDTLLFVRTIRKRIDEYLEFSRTLKAWLAAQKAARPEAAGFLAEMEALLSEVETREAARREKMKTPDYVAKLNDEFRKDGLGLEGPEGTARAKEYGRALTEVGDNQDELVGEFRWIVKTIRQQAGLSMASDPRLGPVAEELRAMTQKMLRNPNALERARH